MRLISIFSSDSQKESEMLKLFLLVSPLFFFLLHHWRALELLTLPPLSHWLLLSPPSPSRFFTHTNTLFPAWFYHPPSSTYPYPSIFLSLSSSSSLPPSTSYPSQPSTSAFSHLVAGEGKCKLCCFKYPCLPQAYSLGGGGGGGGMDVRREERRASHSV